MSQDGKRIFERLGAEGLVRVLDDVLDHRRIVRLANTCDLRYPGMRTQSQKRERLLADLAERGLQDEAAGLTIWRALQKETRAATRRWSQLGDEEKAKRIGDEKFLLSNGNLGLHLLFLATGDDGDGDGFQQVLARQHLLRLAALGRGAARPSKEESRLRKRAGELQKKVQHLEGHLLKSRETERSFKRDLIQRKGELAEARMLVERLRREVADTRETVRGAESANTTDGGLAAESLSKLTKAVRQLAAEQRKLEHRLAKSGPVPAAREDGALRIDPASLEPLGEKLDALRKDIAAQRRNSERQSGLVEELRAELKRGRANKAGSGAVKRARVKGEPERVGVFVDVQNMHYGARRLKGKLDFDALLDAAVRERRLIQATAYVVESKEIDQSGFIALLEHRAIEVRRKTLQVRADGSMKGDWDMELALDILDAAARLDVVVLVSGDGDFTSLVRRVKAIGPRVEVIGFPRATAKSLLQAADHFQPLDRKFMIYPRRTKAGAQAGAGAARRPADQ